MKVALSFPGCHRRAGVERIVLECANFLQDRGHETHVLASDWEDASLRPGVVRHHLPVPVHPSVARLLVFASKSRRELSRFGDSLDNLGAFGVQSPLGGVLWVQSVHRAWLDISQRQRCWKGRMKQHLNLFHPVVLALERNYIGRRKYRKLVALTSDVHDDLVRWYDVPAEDIVTIPNGYAPAEFNLIRTSQMRSEMRSRLGYEDSHRVVIFVANELQRKGFLPLIEAVAGLNDPNVHILAVGRLAPQSCSSSIERLGLASRVKFVGPTSEVADYYAAADVFALPTQYEAWGLVIIEAMACGLPVLTSRLAGAAIAVREEVTGALLDNPSDVSEIAGKLKPLIRGDHARSKDIAESVERFAWPKVLLQYEAILAECTGRSFLRDASSVSSTAVPI